MQAVIHPSTSDFQKPKLKRGAYAIILLLWFIFLIGYGPNFYRLRSDVDYVADRSASANQITLEVSRDMNTLEACNDGWEKVGAGNSQKRLDGVAECVVKHAGNLKTSDGMLFAAKMLFLLNRDPAERLNLIQRAQANPRWLDHSVCLAVADQQDFWTPWPFQLYDAPALRCAGDQLGKVNAGQIAGVEK